MNPSLPTTVHQVIQNGPFQADWDSLAGFQVPAWYQDGKFGIFIHWGPYCVPAFGSEWYPRNMYRQGSPEYEHHLKTYGPHQDFGYKDFIPTFKAEKFDPDFWAETFQRSGARFVVPVAEHHDGFQMYASALSNWNAAVMGPKRDILGELAGAVREKGLVFGLSSHRAEHFWFFDGGLDFDSDVHDPRWADFYGPPHPAPADLGDLEANPPSEAHLQDWLARCCELVDQYRPQLVWFDWWIQNRAFEPYLRQFAAYYYNRAAAWRLQAAINYKFQAFPEGTGVYDIERGQVAAIYPSFWQVDTSVSKNSWGFIEGQDYKTAGDILCDLCDTVSKNGALLLNIGPRPDGTIPEPEVAILAAIGDWLAVNGEAIYDTRPWQIFGEGPTQVVPGSFNDTKRTAFTSRDFRFTTNRDNLYAIALAPPQDGQLLVESVTPERFRVNAVERLGPGPQPRWESRPDGLRLDFVGTQPSPNPVVFRIS